MQAVKSSSSPVVFGIGIRYQELPQFGHSLVAYDIKDTSSGYEIPTWDPIHPQFTRNGTAADEGYGSRTS